MSFKEKPYGHRGIALGEAGTEAKIGRDYLADRGWKPSGVRINNFRWLDRQQVLGLWKHAEDKYLGKGKPWIKDAYKVIGAVLLPFPNDPLYGVARMFYSKQDDEAPKFRTPSNKPATPYIPDDLSTKASVPLLLIESPFKAALATWKGVPGIGINGCTGCHVKGEKGFRPSLLEYLSEGRDVSFATDADCEANPMVGRAQLDFLAAAAAIGCKPVFRPIPKGGIDDYLVNHTVAQFHELTTFRPESKRVARLREFVRRGQPAATYGLSDGAQSVASLLDEDTKPIQYLFDGLLARGACSLLAGPPKGFKSTFALWMALVAVDAVQSNWPKFRPKGKTPLRVGYLDLEQAGQLFMVRVRQFDPDKKAVRRLIRQDRQFKLDAQGLAELERFIRDNQLDLLIIDTLARIKPAHQGKSASDADADLLSPVTRIAHATGCHIMVVTHTGKRKDYDNPIDMIGSTSQLAAAADDIMILYRPQKVEKELYRHLYVSGRHIPDQGNYLIERTPTGFNFIGEAAEVVEGEAKRLVIAVLRDQYKDGAGPTEIARTLGNVDKSNVHRALTRLVESGTVAPIGDGKYQLVKEVRRGRIA